MAIHLTPIDEFLRLAASYPVVDVRSPGEYEHAHIPGAHSLPLFDNAERAAIGTAYKQDSREAAIKIGLDAFGPKMRGMVEWVEQMIGSASRGQNDQRHILVHCWRGGMRSEAVAWLLNFYGFEVHLLEGGYKAYRNWVIGHWEHTGECIVLAGNTGSGKTPVLEELRRMDEPVLDLEGLAKHKGSAFGGLDRILQPSQEMFENLLGMAIHDLRGTYGDRPIWVEDESQRIGDVNIPHQFFKSLVKARRAFLNVPFEQRLDNIVTEYGRHSTESLINAIVRIKKRLGPLETKTAIAHLVEGDIRECFRVLLSYYDKHYYPVAQTAAFQLESEGCDIQRIAEQLKQHLHESEHGRV